ncbi:hypothetical protein H7E67_17630 [Clostridium gasigenes]|uniref:hypothetical protein n=1 Tax=Clostridium gasigenes TaxID=94869 RepID=UPI001624A963|nr:hypothetical protein [Clostridium gasigenes]MBB6625240.1 hypothetical protein [Clostridium gasigenes]
MNNIKVYKMNDYSFVASKWSIEETNKWYENLFDDNNIEDIEELNIKETGMWLETNNIEHLDRLGDSDEITSMKTVNGNSVGCTQFGDLCTQFGDLCTQFGDLMRRSGGIYILTSYEDVLLMEGDFEEPYEIATTEW